MVKTMKNGTELMYDKWNEKIKNIDFVHNFLSDEIIIYSTIFAEKRKKLEGSIEDISKTLNVSCESFFGFLLSLEPILDCNLEKIKCTDTINISLDFDKLHAYLKNKESHAYLAELEGWKDIIGGEGSQGNVENVKKLKVGCLRFADNPYTRMRSFCLLANSFGEEIFYFTPEKIDAERNTIKGLFFDVETEKFIEKETAYPYVIDDHGYFLSQYPELYKKLSQSSLFCYPRLESKKKVYSVLEEGGYSNYLIDTHDYTPDINIDDLLAKHSILILKPNRSSQVKNVFKLHKENDYYYLQVEDNVQKLTKSEYADRYAIDFREGYLVQYYVKSVTNQGNPFNIKVSVRRGKGGRWAIAKLFVRIGDVNGIVSNIQTGSGSIGVVNQFLPAEFGENGKVIYDELLKIAKELPNTLQTGYSNLLDDLTIGVGVDRADNNQLKIFDINIQTDPLTTEADALEARFHYMMYLNENFEKLHEIQQATAK